MKLQQQNISSIKAIAGLALICATITSQIPQAQAALADSLKLANMARQIKAENMLSAGQLNGTSSPWVDISQAPSNFPAPLIHGHQTTFMKPDRINEFSKVMSPYGQQLTINTKDCPGIVAQWYKAYLPSSGYKLSQGAQEQLSSTVRCIRAESDKYYLIVGISGKGDPSIADTQIQITVAPKQTRKA